MQQPMHTVRSERSNSDVIKKVLNHTKVYGESEGDLNLNWISLVVNKQQYR